MIGARRCPPTSSGPPTSTSKGRRVTTKLGLPSISIARLQMVIRHRDSDIPMACLQFNANRNHNISPAHCALNDSHMANPSDLTPDPLLLDRNPSTSHHRRDSLGHPVQP